MQKITLNNKVRFKKLDINPEFRPFFEIKKFSYKTLDGSVYDFNNVNVICELKSKLQNTRPIKNTYNLNDSNKLILDERNNNYDFVEFSIQDIEENQINFEINIHYENELFDSPLSGFNEFEEFYSTKSNTKILFSAPFGQGKTTYLKYFFEQKGDSVELFRLFPVNYSVSHNDDIFQYIKCEILLQLLENKDVQFDKEKLSHLYTIPEFAKKNVHRFLAPFIHLIPKVGGDLYKIYEKLYELGTEYFEYNNAKQVDDKKNAEKFIEQLIEKEGSIFENNFFTQLIRQLIADIKESGKETVLIIDDLDRIDPDHIFRILNVFAAHFDTDEKTQDGLSNKFGFDKIILVCDYHNLLKIFKHRYGHDTDYGGYINKFYSRKPFIFDNKKIIEEYISQIPNRNRGKDDHVSVLSIILNDLNSANQISLREIFKIKHFDIEIKTNDPIERCYYHSLYSILKFLTSFIHPDELVSKFKNCIESTSLKYYNYPDLCKKALITNLLHDKIYQYNNFKTSYKSQEIELILEDKNLELNELYSPILIDPNLKINFTKEDFYTILTMVIEKFKTRLTTK